MIHLLRTELRFVLRTIDPREVLVHESVRLVISASIGRPVLDRVAFLTVDDCTALTSHTAPDAERVSPDCSEMILTRSSSVKQTYFGEPAARNGVLQSEVRSSHIAVCSCYRVVARYAGTFKRKPHTSVPLAQAARRRPELRNWAVVFQRPRRPRFLRASHG